MYEQMNQATHHTQHEARVLLGSGCALLPSVRCNRPAAQDEAASAPKLRESSVSEVDSAASATATMRVVRALPPSESCSRAS